MEDKEKDPTTVDKIIGLAMVISIGYMIGKYGSHRVAIESYRKGVSDTLQSLKITEN